ncbi:uncharacterized protein LTR77_009272 [Saxophila tyrrhenica]|uniref:Gfd2/YDR514C-like C-terminal domain-containing protein n=1 Tax=Saxophila tyrrhenica TaxID=1690608 RepID=A0AAV9NYS0_9PEZI|nr:hypothetical protein LTR77_009272 [Saxophila tyrrhenica]
MPHHPLPHLECDFTSCDGLNRMEDLSQQIRTLRLGQARPPRVRRALDLSALAAMMGLDTAETQILDDVIFLCVDCEAYERAQHKVTEVGVAVLDTRRIEQDGSGSDPTTIASAMQHAHFRPVEYSHLVNGRFVKGCPDSFGFGRSTWIRLADAPQLLARIFSDPSKLSQAAAFDTPWPEKRNVVLVGHGLANDESYMRRLGFDMHDISNIIGYADTQKLAGVNMIALTKILTGLGIHAVNLHNAGNDAAYTLQALTRMVTTELGQVGSVEKRLRQITAKPPEVHTDLPRAEYVWGGTCSPGDERRDGPSRPRKAKRKMKKATTERKNLAT